MSDHPRCYLFIGPPASGKGTHGKAIGLLPGYVHFSTGQAFRSLIPKDDSELVELKEIARLTAEGNLVPDDTALRYFSACYDRLVAGGHFHPNMQILLFDGIPRTAIQAQWILQHFQVLKAFFFSCDEDEIFRRVESRSMKENRADDASTEILKRRIAIYRENLTPMRAVFDPEVCADIRTDLPPQCVLSAILAHL